MMAIRPKELPEITSNWAEADWQDTRNPSLPTNPATPSSWTSPRPSAAATKGLADGLSVYLLAGCTSVIIERVAKDLGIQIDSMKVRAEGFYSPGRSPARKAMNRVRPK